MQPLLSDAKNIFRKFVARWQRFSDIVEALHVADNGGTDAAGEKARRLLANPQHKSTYPDKFREAIRVDRANALRGLRKPLAEAIGHIITIELADAELAGADDHERARWRNQIKSGAYEDHIAFIQTLHAHGISHGHYNALTSVECAAIAKYIKRKATAVSRAAPALRTAAETRGEDGRKHLYWNAYQPSCEPGASETDALSTPLDGSGG